MTVRWYIVPSEQCKRGGIPVPNSRCAKHFTLWNRTSDPQAAWTDYDIVKHFLVAANWQPNNVSINAANSVLLICATRVICIVLFIT